GPITIGTPALNFGTSSIGSNTSILATGDSSITINSGGGNNPLVITGPSDAKAIISTTFASTGSISVTPTAGQSVTFFRPLAADTTEFDLLGGPVSVNVSSGGSATVNAAATVLSDHALTFNVNNAGALTNSGT